MDALWKALIVVLLLLTGCSQSDSAPAAQSLKSAREVLTTDDLQRFLRLVAQLPRQKVPEFVPLKADRIDVGLPGQTLVGQLRDRYRQAIDPRRQGDLWQKNKELARRCQQAGWTPAELAALIQCLSLAVIKDRLSDRHQLSDLLHECRQQQQELIHELAITDAGPRSSITEAIMEQRSRFVLRLSRAIALQELLQELQHIPADNLALVRKHRRELDQFLPQAGPSDPFEDPLALLDLQSIRPASYEAPR